MLEYSMRSTETICRALPSMETSKSVRRQTLERFAGAIHDLHVDADDIHGGAEHGRLRRGRRFLGLGLRLSLCRQPAPAPTPVDQQHHQCRAWRERSF